MKKKIYVFALLTALGWLGCQQKSKWEQKETKYAATGIISSRYWLNDGKKDSIMEVFDQYGVRSGIMRFKNDKQEGKSEFNFPDGRLKEVQFFKHGKREGTIVQYYPNGQKAMESEYKNDLLNGRFARWDSTGRLIVESYFDNDTMRLAK